MQCLLQLLDGCVRKNIWYGTNWELFRQTLVTKITKQSNILYETEQMDDDNSRENKSDFEIQEPKSKKVKISEDDQEDLDEFDSWTCDIELDF